MDIGGDETGGSKTKQYTTSNMNNDKVNSPSSGGVGGGGRETANDSNQHHNNSDLIEHPPSKRINMNRDYPLSPTSQPQQHQQQQQTPSIMNQSTEMMSVDNGAVAHTEELVADEVDSTTNNNNNNNAQQQTGANNQSAANDDEQPMSTSNTNTDDIDDGSRAEATFQLCIRDFSKFRESKESRLSAEPCIVRNLPWKILAMSKQLNNKEFALGFFLQCNADSDSNRWSVAATAELRLLHTSDPEKNVVKKIQHLFYLKENDWGFSPFLYMKEICDPEKGFYDAEKDCVTLEVWVNADAPHGTAWDSKKLTGCVGLTNQGATCYMNSLLQTLFFTNELRKAVYQMPTENDDQFKSVPYALQRVFYDLQFSEKSVGTKKLTRSFGWETLDTFMQHDVQELCRVLMDNLENKMKSTKVEGIIPKLFSGKMISYVKCKHIDYESRRTEGFYDIQLNIKGKKDIYESFKDYITVESLDGENKYDAGPGHGLQEAQKGVIFESFPPVLHLHLMRFQYDPQTDSNIKLNDRYEFYEQIVLDEFLEKPETTSAKYWLHAVLVHSGDNHGGHYVVFINPKLNDKWFKFDDEVVSRCSKKDAITANFGGSQSEEFTFRSSTNAYMLVYVRDSYKDVVLSEVLRSDIPERLQERLAEEKRVELAKKKERNEAHLYMQVNVLLEKEFFDNYGQADLFDPMKIEATRTFKVKKQSTLLDLYKQISESLQLNVDDIRIWSVLSRYNGTIRPLTPYDVRNSELAHRTLPEVSKQDSVWTVFVEQSIDYSFALQFDYVGELMSRPAVPIDAPDYTPLPALTPAQISAAKLPPFKSDDEVMIFFKFYDPKTSTMRYVFRMYLCKHWTLNTVQERLNKKMKFPLQTDLLFFEEVKITHITLLTLKDSPLSKFAHEQLLNGDIYVFQINEEKLQMYKLPTALEYFKDLVLQVEVTFCDKNQPNDEGVTLQLSLKMKYDEFARRLGAELKYDHEKLQFFRTNPNAVTSGGGSVTGGSAQNNTTSSVSSTQSATMSPFAIKYNPEFTLRDAFVPFTAKSFQQQQQQPTTPMGPKRLFYQKLNIKVFELEERRPFRVTWISANLKTERELCPMPFKKGTVKDLLNETRSDLFKENLITREQFEDEANFRLRLVEIVGSRVHRTIREETLIEAIDNAQASTNKYYRIEQILPEEQSLVNGVDYLLPIAHFCKEVYATFGAPFLLKVKLGEPFKDIKARIQKRLDVSDKDFATYRFALISIGSPNYLPEDDDYKFDLSNLSGIQPWLGIDHKNTAAKSKGKYSTMEKAIKIFN